MAAQTHDSTPDRIRHYVDQHFAEPITPRDVAAAMHYSLCHLTHVARKTLGVSVSDLIFQHRIEAAKSLLTESTLPVTVVARRVGFRDIAYFSRRFTRAVGVSPSRWRLLQFKKNVAPPRCHVCGTELPLLALAEGDGTDTRAAAS